MKTVPTIVRLASKADDKRLARMRWDFHIEHDEPLSQTFEEFLDDFQSFFDEAVASGKWFVWVAEADEEIVSHIFVYVVPKVPRPSKTSNSWGYVTNVYTTPPYRGLGVGSELLNHVFTWGESQGLELLIVWPSDDSVEFYRRAGFHPTAEIHERKAE